MQGILIVDKPTNWTSFDVIAKLRGILGTRKLGHSGTLDPMATGVLPVFCGGASKAVDLQLDHTKAYRATLKLGARTDTGDVTGTVLETAPVTAGEKELLEVLPRFVGPRMQTPPMYSAVKINGQPLYKLARQGMEVERKARPIEILSIQYEGSPAENEYTLTVKCSKGTYIRVLLEEIAEAMGQKGTMSALRRVAAGVYTEADAHSLEEIQAAKNAGPEALPALLPALQQRVAFVRSLTEDLFLAAKLEQKQVLLNEDRVALNEATAAVCAACQSEAAQKGVTLRAETDCFLPVWGDNVRLQQVVQNLVTNAIHYTPAGGVVTVTCAREGGTARVTVQDTGCGIAPEDQAAVFDRYFHTTANTKHDSTGLGLTIAQELAHLHHGEITLQSEVGKGSRFTLKLPILE